MGDAVCWTDGATDAGGDGLDDGGLDINGCAGVGYTSGKGKGFTAAGCLCVSDDRCRLFWNHTWTCLDVALS